MSEALERMRPLAAGALLAIFQIAMGEAIEKASERTLRVAARRRRQGGRRKRRDGSAAAQASAAPSSSSPAASWPA